MAALKQLFKQIQGKKSGRIDKKWDFKSGSQIISPPLMDFDEEKDVILFGTKDGKLCCLDSNGKMLWKFNIEEKQDKIMELFEDSETTKSITTRPVFWDINRDGRKEVLFGSDSGSLYCLNATGKLLWSFKTKGPIHSRPELFVDVNEQNIVFGSNDGKLYVVDEQGKLKWHFDANSAVESSPVVFSDQGRSVIVFGTAEGDIFCITSKGRELWRFRAGGIVTAKPAVGNIYGTNDKYIVLGSFDKFLYALDMNGNLEWKYETEGSIRSEATLCDFNGDGKLEIVFSSCDNRVYCLNCNGDRVWSYETDFWVVDSPIVADIDNDKRLEIMFGSYDASVYFLDSEGEFMMNYIPGVSNVMMQSGHFSDDITTDPGKYSAKKLWQYSLGGIVVGGSINVKTKELVFATKDGSICLLAHKKE